MKTSFIEFEKRLREFIRGASARLDFQTLALELFRLQFEHVAPYRKFCEAEGCTPQNVHVWNAIPAIPTTAFKELELTSLAANQRTTVFHSSGTTEQCPSRHFHGTRSLAAYEMSVLAWSQKHIPQDATMIFLTPPPTLAPHSSLVHMFDTIGRNCGASNSSFLGEVGADGGWQLDTHKIVSKLHDLMHAQTPIGLLGTAFNFVHLLDRLSVQKLRLSLPVGSWALETGGYKGRSRCLPKAELHTSMSEVLGISPQRIVCEYGMSELSSQAYDTSLLASTTSARIFHFPPWARVQIISPENGREVAEGEIGLIRAWDLANVYSVMAIETEDLAARRGEGFELIRRARRAEPRGCSLMAG